MLKIGLTGGIGCGKSTAVDFFRRLEIPIIDADQIAKELVKKGCEAHSEIVKIFSPDILQENGELNRSRLKEKVFSDSDALKQLESILHPRIQSEISTQISLIKDTSAHLPYIIIDVPLLIEKNYQNLFDRIIIVDCLPQQQVNRVTQRDNISRNAINNIMSIQATRKQRKEAATDILDNTRDIDTLLSQVKTLHEKLLWQYMNNH